MLKKILGSILVMIMLLGGLVVTTEAKKKPVEFVPNAALTINVCDIGEGWQGPFYDNQEASIIGSSLGLNAVSIKPNKDFDVFYRVYIDGTGWTEWGKNGEVVGVPNKKKPMFAIQIKTKGTPENCISYIVEARGYGWMEEMQEGETAGEVEGQTIIQVLKINVEGI